MRSIFDKETRDGLINRIHALNKRNTTQWGKMNLYQMLKHCTLWEEMVLGKKQYKRAFIGLLFGKLALKKVLQDEAPLRHSTPTLPELVIKEKDGDAETQKAEWISRIQEYEHFSNTDFVHVFFGKMSKEQIGYMVYKHIDHHLRQFNG
ncbi:MAG TPA: DUF1569 domain-containing protein [Cytophaga sp.]|jgi:hypothetical protein|nr:DUF1569 domain-containing protein [Cytophaga sp.]